MTELLKPGDKIWVPGPYLTKHYGIYIGQYFDDGRGLIEHAVVHNSKVQHGVVIDSFGRFCSSQAVTIERRAVPGYESAVVQRALALVGSKYDLLGFNCEHMVNLAQSGGSVRKSVFLDGLR
ncbi:MAG: lecithin retinol acyltransferase family protein [Myxococcales bacterium]|nr:lecithin retinol acyltransferase family protein [Myxococcales bacterium]